MAGWVIASNSISSNRPSAWERIIFPYADRWVIQGDPMAGTWRWFSQNSVITSRTWRLEYMRRARDQRA